VTLRIENPESEADLTEFVLFHDRVYEYRSARWPAMLSLQLPILMGEGPFAVDRTMRPFAARVDGNIVARAVAMIDRRYQRHWKEQLGHIVMFEALPGTREAVKLVMDEACRWLAGQGAIAARAGFGLMEFPFVIDEYETLPPDIARQNPAYYHSLLKEAGFESERGWVDYKIEVTPELTKRYESALEGCIRGGFKIAPLSELDPERRVIDFELTWNDAFSRHWGAGPFSRDELKFLFEYFSMTGGLETSVLAYRGDEPVGALMVTPPSPSAAILAPGRKLGEHEKLNFLGIGVRDSARGRGVNIAMAGYSFLQLIKRGQKFLSYTLVLDDNWPSRRTAEKLGATICANYMVYRRNFRAQPGASLN